MAQDAIIKTEDLYFAYDAQEKNPHPILRGIDLRIEKGTYVAIIGQNGSGKSTLARHLNVLLQPTVGNVWIKDMNTRDVESLRAIRQVVGMVFQNPDNQIVSSTVEEDVAFGPENLGLPPAEIQERVEFALAATDTTELRERPPHLLSGGQKQRVAIAGTLAMKSSCIVFDETTAMLDPVGRQQVLATIRNLNAAGVTIITITHHMEEVVEADRVLVMAEGKIVMDGTPRCIFSQKERLRALDLDVPQVTELAGRLHKHLPEVPKDTLTIAELVNEVSKIPRCAPALVGSPNRR